MKKYLSIFFVLSSVLFSAQEQRIMSGKCINKNLTQEQKVKIKDSLTALINTEKSKTINMYRKHLEKGFIKQEEYDKRVKLREEIAMNKSGIIQNAPMNCTTDFSGPEEKDVYWYHYDHLGSVTHITGRDGEVVQNMEYFPSGEVFVENHKNSPNSPYKFNAKELDDETGYYYYGARYLNPRTSLWLNVDPLAGYDPIMNTEHYIDGQHNAGVYNSGNLNPFIYTYNNPIIYVDPNGKQVNVIKKYLGNLWNDWSPWSRANGRMSGESERDQNRRVGQNTIRNINGLAKASATAEVGHFALDAIGTVEPTPFADGTNAIWYALEGNYGNALISSVAILPYIGDLGKGAKYLAKASSFTGDIFRDADGFYSLLKFTDPAMKDFELAGSITRNGDKMTMEVAGYFKNSNVKKDVGSLGARNISEINQMLKGMAKQEGVSEVTIKYQRSAGSSSKVKGHYFEKTYKLK